MSYKKGVVKNAALARFDMPALKSDLLVGRSADHIEQDAYGKGFASGEKAGFEMGQQQAQILLDKVESLIGELTTFRQKIVRDVEQQCLELSVSIARKIIVKELTLNPEDIVRMTKEALLKLERSGQITIKVNPALYEFFTRHKPDLLAIHPDIVFDADPSVSQYGTVVMGPMEDVVTDVDEQIRNLIKDLGDQYARD